MYNYITNTFKIAFKAVFYYNSSIMKFEIMKFNKMLYCYIASKI